MNQQNDRPGTTTTAQLPSHMLGGSSWKQRLRKICVCQKEDTTTRVTDRSTATAPIDVKHLHCSRLSEFKTLQTHFTEHPPNKKYLALLRESTHVLSINYATGGVSHPGTAISR